MRVVRIIVGMMVFATLVVGPWFCLQRQASSGAHRQADVLPTLWQYWTGRRRTVLLRFAQPTDVALRDPIFIPNGGPEHVVSLERVGEIQALYADGQFLPVERARATEARALLYPSAPAVGPNVRITYRTKPESVAWVIGALFTPERKLRIAAEMDKAMAEHRDEIMAAFRPMIERGLRELAQVLEKETPAAVARHRGEFEDLAAKYQREILDEQLLPLVKAEVWPIVRARADPVLTAVGQEVWKRVSLFRFGWRFAYDLTPLPEKNLLDREWARFVDQDALPVLERHADEFVKLIVDVIRDVSRNKQLQEAARKSLALMAEDPQVRRLLNDMFREVLVENPRFRQTLDGILTGPDAKHAFELASSRLEPALRRIGDMIFGTQAAGVTPEFAEVLRSEILDKDRRWFLLESSDASPDAGTDVEEMPVEYGRR
jgi:hypothetical protein